MPAYQDHHVMPTELNIEAVPSLLSKLGLYDPEAVSNHLNLPASKSLAASLGVAAHNGGPLGSYQKSIAGALQAMEQSETYARAVDGDAEAIGRLSAEFNSLQRTVKAGLVTGNLYTNDVPGVDANAKNTAFFDDLAATEEKFGPIANEIEAMTPAEQRWAAAVFDKERAAISANHADEYSGSLAKGDADAARTSFNDAQAASQERFAAQGAGESTSSLSKAVETAEGELSKLGGTLEKFGKVVGIAGIGIDVATTTAKAHGQYEQGDYRGVGKTVTEFVGRSVGGLVGGILGGALGGAVGSVVPGFGTAAGGIAGGIAGGAGGSVAGEGLADKAYDGIFGTPTPPNSPPDAPVTNPAAQAAPIQQIATAIPVTPISPVPITPFEPVLPAKPSDFFDFTSTTNGGNNSSSRNGGGGGGAGYGDTGSGRSGGNASSVSGASKNSSGASSAPRSANGSNPVGAKSGKSGSVPDGWGVYSDKDGNNVSMGPPTGYQHYSPSGQEDGFSPWSGSSEDDTDNPILLDLTGDGLSVNSLSESSKFIDRNGDGFQERTAWAGSGNGVLVLDADGNGQITNLSEYVFTQWDSNASSDLEAIRDVFDTDGNGKLDSGDARWSEFKVSVNGQLVSLTSLGITSIDLIPQGSGQTFSDGSAITGTTTYSRSDGTTGAVGDAVFATDANGYKISTDTSINGDGSEVEVLTGYAADGGVAFREHISTSADGKTIQTQFDDDGNGTVDRSQTDVLAVDGMGVRTRTVSNYNSDGSLVDQTITVTSADHSTVSTSLDQDGDGNPDETEVFSKANDGATSTTTREFSANGTLLQQSIVAASADGVTITTRNDVNGDGINDDIQSDVKAANGDGSRSEIVQDRSGDGSLLSATTTATSTDARTKTISSDFDGDGLVDKQEQVVVSTAADGDVSVQTTITNRDGSLQSKSTSTTSSDGLSKTTSSDLDGDGVVDITKSDITTVDTSGNSVETVLDISANGAVLFKKVTSTSSDLSSITTVVDENGDGHIDTQIIIAVGSDGSTIDTESNFNPDGSLVSSSVTTTSADGLSASTKSDVDGDGSIDTILTDIVTTNADGGKVETKSLSTASSILLTKIVTTTSADSSTWTVQSDLNGDGIVDTVLTDAITLNSNGSRQEVQSLSSGNGALLSQTTTLTSADRKTISTTIDANGDGFVDEKDVNVINLDGSELVVASKFNSDGSLVTSSSTTISADGLTTSTSLDADGSGTIDQTSVDKTVLNANGSTTETLTVRAANGLLLTQEVTTVSGNGLIRSATIDADGNGVVDSKTTDATVINTDGSKTRTISTYDGASLEKKTITTISANGLNVVSSVDVDGDGLADTIATDVKTLSADGSQVDETVVRSRDGSLLSSTLAQTSSDGHLQTISSDTNGDGHLDLVERLSVDSNGATTEKTEQRNADGSLVSSVTTETSANDKSVKTYQDLDGNGIVDRFATDVTQFNSDGSITETIRNLGADSSLLSASIISISPDGLSQTARDDFDGDGIIDQVVTDTIVLGSDGTRTETLTARSANGTLERKSATVTSADRKTTTTNTDSDGDGHSDQVVKKAVLADGRTSTTTSDFTPNNKLIDSQAVTVSANGLTKNTYFDLDGNGTVDRGLQDITTLVADGSRVESIWTWSGNSKLLSRSTTTISGNGLSTAVANDVNGDGVIDSRSSTLKTLNADGSTTTVVSDFLGSTLADKTTTTSSATGLSGTTATDFDGDGINDRVASFTKTLNANGSTAEIDTLKSANGTLLSKVTTNASADGYLDTVDADIDGDGHIDFRETISVTATGTATDTTDELRTDGTLNSRSVVSISANGLSKTSSADIDGDGIFDLVETDVTTLNADGSQAEVITEFGAGNSLISRTTNTATASGLGKTSSWADSSGNTVRSASDVTVLNADGGTTETLSYFKADGSLESKTISIVTAHGLTTTVTQDIDGDDDVDQRSVSTKNTDGSVTQVLSDLSSAGTTQDAETVTTSANGLSQTRDYDSDGNGIVDKRVSTVTTLNADGSKTTTTTLSTAGTSALAVTSATVVTTSGDGLTVSSKWDTTGSGTFTGNATDITVLNADGSKTRTVSNYSGTTLTSRYQTTVSANGFTITTQSDTAGTGTYDQVSTDVTVLNADGSKTETVTSSKADGTVISKFVTSTNADGLVTSTTEQRAGLADQTLIRTIDNLADGSSKVTTKTMSAAGILVDSTVVVTSADGLTVTTDRDANGDGIIDQHRQSVTANSGTQVITTADYKADGTIADRTVETVSADGRTTVIDWDLDGNGTNDRERVIADSANADGSHTSVISDTNLSTGKLATKITSKVSADGMMRTSTRDVDGDGTIDQVDTLTSDVSGASMEIVTNNAAAQKVSNLSSGVVYWSQAIAAKVETDRSSDDRTTVSKYDFDGDGAFEVVMQTVLQVDGSTLTSVTERTAAGVVKATGTITTTADGLITTLSKDTDNNGVIDHTETAVTHADGSTTLSKVDRNPDGTLKQTIVDTTNALGSLILRITSDAQGRKTAQTVFNADGTSIYTTYDAASGQILSISNAGKDGLLTSATLYDPLHTQPWTRVEQSFDVNGKKTLEKQYNDDGTRTEITFQVATGAQSHIDYFSASNIRTASIDYDLVNAAQWTRVQQNYDAAGRVTYRAEFNDVGTETAYTYDPTNAASWSYILQLFNTAGQLTQQNQYNDNGSFYVSLYDPTNVQPWYRVDAAYDSSSRETSQTNYNDDGTRYGYVWDVTNAQPWSYVAQTFNTSGLMTNQTTVNDDGSQAQYTWDVFNAYNWSYVADTFNAAVQHTANYVYYDTPGQYTATFYDYNSSQPWTSIAENFVGNVIQSATSQNDVGGYTNYVYHNGSVQSWKRYDSHGHLVDQYPTLPDYGASHGNRPVLLDLDGDGHIDLRPLDTDALATGSTTTFDWNSDGARDGTAWVGPQDGFLAIDLGENGQAGPDGVIDQAKELAFSLWATDDQVAANGGDVSDLDGLRLAFDSNHDNVLDVNDDRWNDFRVWRDVNQNGVTDPGELETMSEAGIKLINLMPSSNGSQAFSDGSAITGTSSYQTVDGNQYLVGDAKLVSQPAIPNAA